MLTPCVSCSAIHKALDVANGVVPERIGVAVSVAVISPTQVVSCNLGTCGCWVLQPAHGTAVQLSAFHDALNPAERDGIPPDTVVTRLSHDFILLGGFCSFTRCLGLPKQPFISRVPHVNVYALRPQDGVVVLGNRATLECMSAVEMSGHSSVYISAREMCTEFSSLIEHRDVEPVLAVMCT